MVREQMIQGILSMTKEILELYTTDSELKTLYLQTELTLDAIKKIKKLENKTKEVQNGENSLQDRKREDIKVY
jgi:hypothetical protein